MSQLLPAALATSKKTQISKKKGWEQTVHTAELLYEEMLKRGKCQLGRETKTQESSREGAVTLQFTKHKNWGPRCN